MVSHLTPLPERQGPRLVHEVLDRWFVEQVRPRMRGPAHLIRSADDFVIVFENGSESRRVMAVLGKRFGKHGLALHPEKTQLIDYRRPRVSSPGGGGGKPPTLAFLVLTHHWGRSRQGYPIVKRTTARGRLTLSIRRVSEWCKRNRHVPVADQHRYLSAVLRGHYSYFGITGNGWSLSAFRHLVGGIWHYWLGRRSQCRSLTWEGYARLRQRYQLPPGEVVHSIYRLAANPCA